MWSHSTTTPTVLAATRTGAGAGGIARVGRLSAQALLRRGVPLSVRALLDGTVDVPAGDAAAFAGGRLGFAARLQRDALSHGAFLFDHVGLARAHPRWPRRPLAVWLHGVEVWGDGLTPARAAALRRADRVICNSRFTLERFEADHWPLPDARVCWLGTEEDAAPPPAPPAEEPVVLLVGRVDRDNMRKGHREVVEAWPRIVSAVPGARLLIAGSGDGLGALKGLVAASGAAGAIEVLGFVPEAQMPALWRRARLYVQPSWKEGFGLTYVEAMRHGRPVIASVNDAGREVNAHGVSGYNVDLRRPGELAEQVVELLRDACAVARLSEGARARWEASFRFRHFEARFREAIA